MRSNQPEVRLGDFVELLFGFPFKSQDYTDDPNGTRLLRGDNIVQGQLRWDGVKRWPTTQLGSFETYALREGDVVLAMDRPWIEAGLKYACLHRDDLPALLVQRVARLRGCNGLETSYLRWILGSPRFTQYVRAVQTGTAVPHISGGQISDFTFRLPPLSEQRAIAHILGTLDDKIELNRKMNETLDEIARTLFTSWFVTFDPVSAKAEGRQPEGMDAETAALFPDRFVDSELGPIPEGWHIGRLDKNITVTKGRSYRSDELGESPRALVTLKSFLRGGGYREDGLKGFAGTWKPEQVIQSGEIIVALTDVTQAADVIGGPAIVIPDSKYSTLIGSLDIAIVRPRNGWSNAFLYGLLGSASFNHHARSHTTGTTVLHLSAAALGVFHLAHPPQQLTEAFTLNIEPLYERVSNGALETRTLAELRNTLLPELISGRLRVPDVEQLIGGAG